LTKQYSVDQIGSFSKYIVISASLPVLLDFGFTKHIISSYNISKKEVHEIKKNYIKIPLIICLILILFFYFSKSSYIALIFLAINNFLLYEIIFKKALLIKNGLFKKNMTFEITSKIIGLTFLGIIFLRFDTIDINVLYFSPLIFTNFIRYLFLIKISKNLIDKSNYTSKNQLTNRFSVPIYIDSLLSFGSYNLDVIILSYLGANELAAIIIIIKSTFNKALSIILPSINSVYFTKISKLHSIKQNVWPLYKENVLFSQIPLIFIISPFILFPNFIFGNIFSEEYSMILDYLLILTFIYIIRSAFSPIGSLIAVFNNMNNGLYFGILQILLILVLSYISAYQNFTIHHYLIGLLSLYITLIVPHYILLIKPIITQNGK